MAWPGQLACHGAYLPVPAALWLAVQISPECHDPRNDSQHRIHHKKLRQKIFTCLKGRNASCVRQIRLLARLARRLLALLLKPPNSLECAQLGNHEMVSHQDRAALVPLALPSSVSPPFQTDSFWSRQKGGGSSTDWVPYTVSGESLAAQVMM